MSAKPTYEELEKKNCELEKRLRIVSSAISTKYPLMNEGGKIYDIGGLSSDITEHANVSQELREKDKLFRTAIKHSPIAIVVSEGIDQIVIIVNDRFTDLFGYTMEDIPDVATWWVLAYPDKAYREKIRIRWTKAVEKSFSGQSHVELMEVTIACKDGSLKEVSVEAATVGEVNIVTFVDMTEHKQNEEILHKSHEMLKRTEAIANIGSWEWDVQNDQTYWSEELFRIFGRHPAEGEPSFAEQSKFYVNEDFQYLKDAVERCAKQGTPYEIEVRAIQTDGEIRHCVSRGQPQYDENGKVFRVFGSFQDITDRKQTEEVLKLNYELLHIAGETAKFGGWSVDLEKNICMWSDAVADIHDVPHGYAPPVQEAINFYTPEWREKITQCFSACAKDGIPYDEVMEIITQKGKRVWVRATGRSVKNEKDKIIKVQGSFQDITEYRLAEEALRLREEMMRNSQSVAHICSYSTDLNVNEINKSSWVCSPEFYKIFGIDKTYPHTIEGWANFIHPDYRKAIFDYHESVVKEKTRFSREYKIIRINDGEERWVHGTGKLEFDEKGNPVRMHGAIQDITDRKNTEEHLRQAQKMEALGTLASGIAHDFNNILSSMIGFTELAKLGLKEDEDTRSNLEEVITAGLRARDLVKHILTFSRKADAHKGIIQIVPLIKECLKFLKASVPPNIEIRQHFTETDTAVLSDATQFHQILMNLFTNAAYAMKEKGGTLEVQLDSVNILPGDIHQIKDILPGNYVQLNIKDTGCGIPKNSIEKIFEPFFTTKDRGEGTGMGLSTVYGIIKEMKGDITVHSEEGIGSSFQILIPEQISETQNRIDSGDVELKTGKGRILLVDDEPSIIKWLTQVLVRLGYDPSGFTNGLAVIETFKQDPQNFDLIFTDLAMPKISGLELAKQIKKIRSDIPIVLCTGFSEGLTKEKVYALGISDMVMKPMIAGELAQTIANALDNKKRPE